MFVRPGGPAILATDTLVAQGISVPSILGKTNPIDLMGDAKADEYRKDMEYLENTFHS